MMKKVLLIVTIFLISISSLFSATDTRSTLELQFTAGLIVNIGFTNKAVSDMIYPEENLLKDDISFTYNSSTSRFETDEFYVFAQVFSPNIASISLEGTRLYKDGDSTSTSYLSWTNTSALSFNTTNGTSSVDIYTKPSDQVFTPSYESYSLKLRINRIPSSIDWTSEYKGTLTIKIVAGN